MVVGTGLKDPDAGILMQKYNSSAWNYELNEGDQSMWTYVPNRFTQDPMKAQDPAGNGKEVLNLVVIVAVCIVVILGVVCGLEWCRKRREAKVLAESEQSKSIKEDKTGLLAK